VQWEVRYGSETVESGGRAVARIASKIGRGKGVKKVGGHVITTLCPQDGECWTRFASIVDIWNGRGLREERRRGAKD